jgi:hypothetical protein
MDWGFVDIKRIDLGLNTGQGWFPNFSDAPPLLDKYVNIFCGNCGLACYCALQRQNAENFKQIFPEKEYRGLSPNFHIHVSVSELYIPTMGLPFLLEEIC